MSAFARTPVACADTSTPVPRGAPSSRWSSTHQGADQHRGDRGVQHRTERPDRRRRCSSGGRRAAGTASTTARAGSGRPAGRARPASPVSAPARPVTRGAGPHLAAGRPDGLDQRGSTRVCSPPVSVATADPDRSPPPRSSRAAPASEPASHQRRGQAGCDGAAPPGCPGRPRRPRRPPARPAGPAPGGPSGTGPRRPRRRAGRQPGPGRQHGVQRRSAATRAARSPGGRRPPTGGPGCRGIPSPAAARLPARCRTQAPTGFGSDDPVGQAEFGDQLGDRGPRGGERLGAGVEGQAADPVRRTARRRSCRPASSTIGRRPARARSSAVDQPGDPAADHHAPGPIRALTAARHRRRRSLEAVDELDQPGQHVRVGVRRDAVAEVDHVAGRGGAAPDDVGGLRVQRGPVRRTAAPDRCCPATVFGRRAGCWRCPAEPGGRCP